MNALANTTASAQRKGATAFTPAEMVPNALLGQPDVSAVVRASKPQLYAWIAAGLFPPPVKLGAKTSAWPCSEVNAVLAARIRGATEDELRALVVQLTEARKSAV
jgi:prophage regulatory protein